MAVDCAKVVRQVNVDANSDSGDEGEEQSVEDELLSRGKHVDGKRDLVLVDLQAHPADDAAQDPEKRHGEEEPKGVKWSVSRFLFSAFCPCFRGGAKEAVSFFYP